MSLILSNIKCPECGNKMYYHPGCSGDYYVTVYGLVLQCSCINCGCMHPPITYRDSEYMSNDNKKRFLSNLASYNRKRFKEYRVLYHTKLKHIEDRVAFVRACAIETQTPIDIVAGFCGV